MSCNLLVIPLGRNSRACRGRTLRRHAMYIMQNIVQMPEELNPESVRWDVVCTGVNDQSNQMAL
jgi:hypothetical protein